MRNNLKLMKKFFVRKIKRNLEKNKELNELKNKKKIKKFVDSNLTNNLESFKDKFFSKIHEKEKMNKEDFENQLAKFEKEMIKEISSNKNLKEDLDDLVKKMNDEKQKLK